MAVFVDLHLYKEEKAGDPEVLFKQFASNIDYSRYLDQRIHCIFIQHAPFSHEERVGNTLYVVKKARNYHLFNLIPLLLEVRQYKPDVLLMHGMIHPLRILLAALILGKRTAIWVQNHAEKPATGVKRWLQRLAGKYIQRCLMVSSEQFDDWHKARIFQLKEKLFEIMEGSNHFRYLPRERRPLPDAKPSSVFLWVGRLDENKDPRTVIRAFEDYLVTNPNDTLKLVYSGGPLELELRAYCEEKKMRRVEWLGYVEHEQLERYFQEADYFVAASHYEGSGYALCEAMSCGCIPIVSDIPSFRKMTMNGKYGALFKKGDVKSLLYVLEEVKKKDSFLLSAEVRMHFEAELSFSAIAAKISSAVLAGSE